jgi:hypothetical protein
LPLVRCGPGVAQNRIYAGDLPPLFPAGVAVVRWCGCSSPAHEALRWCVPQAVTSCR